MGSFLNNQQAYNIHAENEASVILSNFNTSYIHGVIEDLLQERLTKFDSDTKPNFVLSYEMAFKEMLQTHPEDVLNINYTRDTTYEEIMNIIAKAFDMELLYDDSLDKFTLASWMYDFFISNYDAYVCQFFSRFITKERDGLYTALGLDADKKSKDVSTIYNKKQYDDAKMAIINANLERAIGYVKQLDFPIEQVLSFIYTDRPEVVNLFMNHLRPNVDFFKSSYSSLLDNPMVYPLAMVMIKLDLQRLNTESNEYSSLQQL